MAESFSISNSRFKSATDPKLRDEIHHHTQSDIATATILRSISRFGVDATIERYEMTPKTQYRSAQIGSSIAWTVRAVRAASSLKQPEAI